jgi:hypothetical protein
MRCPNEPKEDEVLPDHFSSKEDLCKMNDKDEKRPISPTDEF